MNGRVKWFNGEKGYGYIEYKKNGDICIHCISLNNSKNEVIKLNLIESANGYILKNNDYKEN